MTIATSTAPAPPGPQRRGPHARGAAEGPLRVLLVDDRRENRMLVTSVLTRWGIVPTIACNGAQAVQLAQRRAFDIVLMDILMPVMDGVVATAKIRQAEREDPARSPVPIVAYTSLDLSALPTQLQRVGVTDVLAKPCSASTLQACLALHCRHRFSVGV